METKKTWTREEIEQLINTNDRMVERSMVVLWERQTRDEQASQTTNHHNGMGFTGWSARSGTSGMRCRVWISVASRVRLVVCVSGQVSETNWRRLTALTDSSAPWSITLTVSPAPISASVNCSPPVPKPRAMGISRDA